MAGPSLRSRARTALAIRVAPPTACLALALSACADSPNAPLTDLSHCSPDSQVAAVLVADPGACDTQTVTIPATESVACATEILRGSKVLLSGRRGTRWSLLLQAAPPRLLDDCLGVFANGSCTACGALACASTDDDRSRWGVTLDDTALDEQMVFIEEGVFDIEFCVGP